MRKLSGGGGMGLVSAGLTGALGGFWVRDTEVSFAAEKIGVKLPRLRTGREVVALKC